MKKSKFFANSIVAVVALFTILMETVMTDVHSPFSVRGEPTQYSILFQTAKNKIATGGENPAGYDGSGQAVTELGNPIAFDYQGLVNPSTNWQTFKTGGFITNTIPIHGLMSLSLEKANTDAHIGVYWSADNIFDAVRYVEFDSSTSLNVSTDFNGYKPNYIKIVGVGATDAIIKSGHLTYTCTDSHPEVGTIITLGTYPQTRVTDSTLIDTLTSAAGTLPSSGNNQAWTDYGYYISGSLSSFMWYIDLTDGDDQYRGVYFTSYRPHWTGGASSTSSSYQDDNGYYINTIYWFKYEPIPWKIIAVANYKAFLVADLVLDGGDYHYSQSNRNINGSTVYANNYEHSHIRAWLNDSFYNTAFNTDEKSIVATTNVDNSPTSTGRNPNSYASQNTNDKVFLLSYQEVTNASYGFTSNTSRERGPSDYALAQGVVVQSTPYNYWWLRSPAHSTPVRACYVSISGVAKLENNYSVNSADIGIVPAMYIEL